MLLYSIWVRCTHCNGNSVCIFLFWELLGLSPNFHIHVSVSDFSRKGRPIVGIYNSLTDTWMWKLGLRPWYSFSGNICFKFSAFFSVQCVYLTSNLENMYFSTKNIKKEVLILLKVLCSLSSKLAKSVNTTYRKNFLSKNNTDIENWW